MDERLRFDYDPHMDILTIEGVRYSGGLFRALGEKGLATDRWFKIVSREDGILTVFQAPMGASEPIALGQTSGSPQPEWQLGPNTRDTGCKCIVSDTFADSSNCSIHSLDAK